MKASGLENSEVVDFNGEVQRIARVNQYGLKDKLGRNGSAVDYPECQLLVIGEEDRQRIEQIIIDTLAL